MSAPTSDEAAGLERGLRPVLEGQQLGQILFLPRQQSQILAQGAGILLPSQSCWSLAADGAGSQPVPTLCQPHCSQGSLLLLLPSSNPPHPQTGARNTWCHFWPNRQRPSGEGGTAGSCYPNADPHGAALFSWPLCPHSRGYLKALATKEGKLLSTESPDSCKDQFETTKWEPGRPAEDGVGQWDLAWHWDTHGAG